MALEFPAIFSLTTRRFTDFSLVEIEPYEPVAAYALISAIGKIVPQKAKGASEEFSQLAKADGETKGDCNTGRGGAFLLSQQSMEEPNSDAWMVEMTARIERASAC